MTKDETIEPSLAENNGLTPSKHGFSAALRAQVIEECAKAVESYDGLYYLSANHSPDDVVAWAAKAIRSLSAVSAIAQERDVGELVEDIDEAADELIDSVQYLQETMAAGEGVYESKWLGGVMSAHEMLLRLSEHIKHADAWPCDGEGDEHGNFVCKKDRDAGKPVAYRIDLGHGFNYYDAAPGKYEKLQAQGRPIQALYPTTSPKAIGEEPSSSEAVNTTPQSIEVGEMVERHGFTLTWYPEVGSYRVSKPNIGTMDVVPASLLIALDAERGRLREALTRIARSADDTEARSIARSTLPASDEK